MLVMILVRGNITRIPVFNSTQIFIGALSQCYITFVVRGRLLVEERVPHDCIYKFLSSALFMCLKRK